MVLHDHQRRTIRRLYTLCKHNLGDDLQIREDSFKYIVKCHYPFLDASETHDAWLSVKDHIFFKKNELLRLHQSYGSKIHALFNHIDINSDGVLSQQEFEKVVKGKITFSSVDTNADGRITMDEFYDFIIKHPVAEKHFDDIIVSLQERMDNRLCQYEIFKVPISEMRNRRPSLHDVDFRHMYFAGHDPFSFPCHQSTNT